MNVSLVTSTKGEGKYSELNEEEIIAAIARHGIVKEDNGKLVKYLMDNHHWSPLDMVDFGFEIETSRAIGRQFLRHFSLKPQEHSQRYSDKVSFEHVELRKEDEKNRQSSTEVFDPIIEGNYDTIQEDIIASSLIGDLLKQLEEAYTGLIEAGVAKECARMILPECTTSILTFKGSIRSWLAFLNVRCDHHAQKEIQEIATLIGQELEKKLPNIFKQIDWKNGMFM